MKNFKKISFELKIQQYEHFIKINLFIIRIHFQSN